MNNKLSASVLWNILWKRKFHLLILTIIGFIIGVIFSGARFITPKFKSVAVVYPSNIQAYSEESESEQLMQWMKSNDLKFKIIDDYKLYEHYDINRDAAKAKAFVLREYDANIKVELTSSQAVRITVLDKDPVQACEIANSIVEVANNIIDSTHNVLFLEVLDNYNQLVAHCKKDLNDIEETLKESDENGTALFGLLNAIGGQYMKKDTTIYSSLNNLLQLINKNDAMQSIYKGWNLAKLNADRNFTHYSYVQKPFPADKKSTPVRWVIVLLSGLALFILAYAVFVFIEKTAEEEFEKI